MELTHELREHSGLQWVLDRLVPLSPFGRAAARAPRWYGPGEEAALADELDNLALSLSLWDAKQLPEPEETDAMATKVLVTPTWTIEGATAKVEACNNAFDDVPTWEDITAQVMINRVFMFQNKTKTAEKWGVDIRFTITKNEGYEGEVSISGFGGAYE